MRSNLLRKKLSYLFKTFPITCPYLIEQLLNENFFSNSNNHVLSLPKTV